MGFREGGSAAGNCGCCMPRRGFLAALAGGASLAAGVGRGIAAPAVKRGIVDVHAHYVPAELKAAGGGGGPLASWTIEKHLEGMDQAGVARSILSLTQPGVTARGEEGRALVRKCNEAGARLAADHPGRIGFFTYVELSDIDATLKEIAYGFDTLKTQGVAVFTNYGGKHLGDPMFDPVWEELNRRKAVVHIHPTLNNCCTHVVEGVPDGTIEFGTETTRAIARYVYGGAGRKFPDVKMIWSHSGGSMPSMIERFKLGDRNPAFKQAAPDGIRAELAKMFYDVALGTDPAITAGLRNAVPVSQIVFGTDFPFASMKDHVDQLEANKIFTAAELTGLYRGNVAKGLPTLIA